METILRAVNISKRFPGVQALRRVSFDLRKGEVHGLVGENGAGKSTLMHILAGVYQPEEGTIFVRGTEIKFRDERDAQGAGIGMVFQERSLVSELSVAENIFAGRQPAGLLGIIDSRRMMEMAKGLLEQVGLEANPSIRVGRLSPSQQQLVEIAKALSLDAQILILDEPTATITAREIGILFELIRRLQNKGMSVIYISHRLQELPHICDRVTVLKDGVYQGTRIMREVDLSELVLLMVGRKVVGHYVERQVADGPPVLEVQDLSSRAFKNVNFRVRRGEILGIAGLAGAGRTELALALFGADRAAQGRILVDGREVKINSPAKAMNLGLGYMTEDRKSAGLFLDLNVASNVASANLARFTHYGLLRDRELRERAREFVRQLRIATPSLSQRAINLSGGNQQKVLMARWLMRHSRILIIDEPTRGVDIGAKQEIYQLIRMLADQGTSVIVISSELPEVMTLCDRIVVMWQGKVTGELENRDATEEKIMRLASGL